MNAVLVPFVIVRCLATSGGGSASRPWRRARRPAHIVPVLLALAAVLLALSPSAVEAGDPIGWGDNTYGQCTVPPEAQSGVVAISANGIGFNLALKDTGEVIAWGYNINGECDVPVAAQSGVIAVSAGGMHSTALRDTGEVIAWGYNGMGQLNVPAAAQSGVTAIDAGTSFTLALDDTGEVIAWGFNAHGQCNVPAEAQSGVIAISGGGSHSLALKDTGEVLAWGYNYNGQTNVPTEAQSSVIAIAAGAWHSLALKDTGEIIGWGENEWGQCTVPPEAQSGVIAIAAGANHSLALKDTGEVIAWGSNNQGQCNVPPEADSGVLAISGATYHTLVLSALQADFSGSPTSGEAPLTVDFADLSTNSPTAWDWTFGDGGTSTDQHPSHEYTSPGLYTVSLTATNAEGWASETKTDYITVSLLVDFSGTPTTGPVPLTVDFTDLSDSPTAWDWTFGDGGVSTEQHPTHTYLIPDMYTVSLTASNAQGEGTEVKTDYISVIAVAPVAEFLGIPTSGPVPLTVYFTDQSTNNPSWWSWDFGDTGTSWLQSPSHEYASTGQFTVSLTVANAAGSDTETKTNYITVAAPPVADFVGNPTSGPVPLTVDFTDQSTNDPTSWDWDFGDAGTSSLQNPSHEYTSTGQFTVSLTAANAGGSDTETKTEYITVTLAPDADFVGNRTIGPVPLTVDFTDQSTNTPTAWDWDFGDGGFDTAQDPSHEYTSTGQFTVSLTATNAEGSSTETKTNYITVTVPPPVGEVIAWGWNDHEQCNVPTAAESGVTAIAAGGQHTLALKATGEVIAWGYNGTGECDVPTEAQSGVIAIGGGAYHSLAVKDTGEVIAWGSNGYSVCTVPAGAESGVIAISTGHIHNLALTSAGALIAWGYDDYGQVSNTPTEAGFTAIAAGGYHSLALTETGEVIAWGRNGLGQCDVPQGAQGSFTAIACGFDHSLALTDTGEVIAWGDEYLGACDVPPAAESGVLAIAIGAGACHSLALVPLQADFSGSPASGLAPLTVDFTDESTSGPTSWDWDFGDTGTSTDQHPSHEYTSPGLYTVSLTATNAEGFNTVTKIDYIAAAELPVADFVGDVTSGTVPLTVIFTDLSTNGPTAWEWEFGDGGLSTDQHPSHTYVTPGMRTVSLTATNAGGSDTETKIEYISVLAVLPVAGFSGDPISGPVPLTVNFTDQSANSPVWWSWDFGDTGTSSVPNPSHEYTSPGQFTVSLTVANAAGSDTETKTDYITVTVAVPPVADFVGDPTTGPAPLTVGFTDQSTNGPTSWEWDFGDTGTSTDQNPSHEYLSPGTYTVSLTVANAAGSDTETKSDYISVGTPGAADFSATPTSGSAPLTVDFTDLSTGDVLTWEWDFGDGGTSTDQNPTHEYTTAGVYTVTLAISDYDGGDTATKIDYITVGTAGAAAFSATPTEGIMGMTVDFTDESAGDVVSWEWDFGDGGTSTEQSPSHLYADPGIYDVSLTVTGAYGSDVETKTGYIWVGFLDCGPDNWAFENVLLCVDAEIVQGYAGGYYEPTWPVNRGQMAVYISRTLAGGDSGVPDATPPATFDDVPDDYWAWKYVEYAVTENVVTGYDPTTYAPEVEVDRGQMAVFIARASGWISLGDPMDTALELFPDVPAGFWSGTAIEACVDNLVVQGYEDGNYYPDNVVTRDQMAVYVARAFGLYP